MTDYKDLIERLRMHDDERLYEQADSLMSEAADAILAMCDLMEQMRNALIIGLDLAVAEATRFHEAYAGYKKAAHKAVDDDVEQIRTALAAFDKWNNELKG